MATLVERNKYFELYQVTDGVYAAIINKGTGCLGNAGIIDLGDATLVFDTFLTPIAAKELKMVAELLFDRPVKYVINSHFHMDHIGGNQVFEDAMIISEGKTKEMIELRSNQFLSFLKENPDYADRLQKEIDSETDALIKADLIHMLGDVKVMNELLDMFEVTLPELTFSNEITILGSEREVLIKHMGVGHSSSDSILFLPAEQILFAGDLLLIHTHPSFKDGDPFNWIDILEELESSFNFTHVIPGHGSIGTIEDINKLKKYFIDMKKFVSQQIELGVSIEKIDKSIPTQYGNWSQKNTYEQLLEYIYNKMAEGV